MLKYKYIKILKWIFRFFIVAVFIVCFVKAAKIQFNKIENRYVDINNYATYYSKKDEIYNLLIENQEFLEGLVSDLSNIENIELVNLIGVPYNCTDEQIRFSKKYDADENKEVILNDNIKKKLHILSNDLKFDSVYVKWVTTEDDSVQLVFTFTQSSGIERTFIDLNCCAYDKSLLPKKPQVGYKFYSKIDNVSSDFNWYYGLNRRHADYNFWFCLYDIWYGNR